MPGKYRAVPCQALQCQEQGVPCRANANPCCPGACRALTRDSVLACPCHARTSLNIHVHIHIEIHTPYMGPGPAAAVRPSWAHVRYVYAYVYVCALCTYLDKKYSEHPEFSRSIEIQYFQNPGLQLCIIKVQYFQDPGSSKRLEIQYFQDSGILKRFEIQYFQDPGSSEWPNINLKNNRAI